MITYTYSIQNDFPSHAVASDRLTAEISGSAIVTALDHIDTSGDDCDIVFKAGLSVGDKTVLNGLVAAHSGEPLPQNKATLITTATTTEEGTVVISLDCPREKDHKPVMVNSPATEGTFTWLSACGDNLNPTPPASGRGNGAHLMISFTEPDTKEVEAQFMEPVELHDGHISWRPMDNWDFEDSWSISVRMPATVATENVTNTGNCNLYPTGLGFNIIIPAAGDGTYDISFDQAVPIPDGHNEKSGIGVGYWDVDQYWSEEITPNGSDKDVFNLYDIPLEMFFCKNMDCGNPLSIWDLDAYKAEWISRKWKLCFSAVKTTAGAGKIGGFFMIFRPGAI
jgi:hypothetical protein